MPRITRSKKAILSIDGGGVKCLLTLEVLRMIEEELREASGVPDLLIAEAFDLISGTSAGAIVATGLTVSASESLRAKTALGNGSVGEIQQLAMSKMATIFDKGKRRWALGPKGGQLLGGAKYPNEPLKQCAHPRVGVGSAALGRVGMVQGG